jgi:hypothetical protein
VKVWSYAGGAMWHRPQFCGLIMGDHAKSGINTMFNTGTVVGVAPTCSAAASRPNTSLHFAWGGAEGFETYDVDARW